MAEIDIRGVIASNDDAWIYRWFGYEATSPADVTRVLQEAGGEEVVVRINSYGGDVWSASEIYTSLRAYTGPIITVVTGLAASAASVILMAGKPVRASPTAEIMIHNPSMQAEGDYREMERARKELINTRNAILNAYELKTGLTRSTLRQMMDRPAWMTAQTAKRRGFIDEVLFAGDGDLEVEESEDAEAEGYESSSARAAALQIPSAAILRAEKRVWDELSPCAASIAEARRHRTCVRIDDTGSAKWHSIENAIISPLMQGMSDGALIETSGMPIEDKRPEKETKTETGGETHDQEEKRLLRERIRTLGA